MVVLETQRNGRKMVDISSFLSSPLLSFIFIFCFCFYWVQGFLLLTVGPLIGMSFLSTPMVAAHTYVSSR